jgi:hypothetical protein
MNNLEHKPTVLIDTGHSSFKFALKVAGKIPSVRSMPTALEKDRGNNTPTDQTLEVNGHRYLFGNVALAHLPVDSTFHTSDAFIGSQKFYLLIRAILKVLKPAIPVNISVAIPDGMVKTRRIAIENSLKTNELFLIDNSPLLNDVLVVGQSFAASLAPELRNKSKNALFVDIGHKTILLTLRQRSEIQFERSRSLEAGGGALIRQIAALHAETDSERARLSADLMQSVLQKGQCKYKGRIIQVDDDSVAQTSWIQDSMMKILEVISTVDDIETVVLSGHSGRFLAAAFQTLGPHLKVVEVTQPQFAVLRGLLVLTDVKGAKK